MREYAIDHLILPSKGSFAFEFPTLLIKSSVVVATGLIVLVDDCINRRWHPKSCNQSLALPFEMDVDHDGSKHLINESLNRGKEQGIQSPILS